MGVNDKYYWQYKDMGAFLKEGLANIVRTGNWMTTLAPQFFSESP